MFSRSLRGAKATSGKLFLTRSRLLSCVAACGMATAAPGNGRLSPLRGSGLGLGLGLPLWRRAQCAGALRAASTSGGADGDPSALSLALVQMKVGADKPANIEEARARVAEAASKGARLVCLPECWNSPYATESFPVYAEPVPEVGGSADAGAAPTASALCAMARENGVWLVGGSIPEVDGGKVYNTCIVLSPEGEIVAKHRKVHLFDIDVPGGITFKESDTLSPGGRATTFETPWGTVGVGICYDVRFPELSMIMRGRGAFLLLFPGAFNLTTGPKHWELLARARAVDNQCFVAVASPSRVPGDGYQAWGHSSVVDPWGEVLETTGHEADIVYATLSPPEVDKVRSAIPVSLQKRDDLYEVRDKQ